MPRLRLVDLLSEVFDVQFQFRGVVVPLIVFYWFVGPCRRSLLPSIFRLSVMIQVLLIKHGGLLARVLSHMLQSAQVENRDGIRKLGLILWLSIVWVLSFGTHFLFRRLSSDDINRVLLTLRRIHSVARQ